MKPLDQMEDVVAQLREFEDLAGCEDDELAELAEHCSPVSVPRGWAFIIEGTPGESCFVVLDGEVSVTRAGEEINQVGAGGLVGEVALLEQQPRTATCIALTPLRLLELEASEFNGWLQQRPRIRDRLLAAAQRRTGPFR